MIYELHIRYLNTAFVVEPKLCYVVFVGSGISEAVFLKGDNVEAEISLVSELIRYDDLPFSVAQEGTSAEVFLNLSVSKHLFDVSTVVVIYDEVYLCIVNYRTVFDRG